MAAQSNIITVSLYSAFGIKGWSVLTTFSFFFFSTGEELFERVILSDTWMYAMQVTQSRLCMFNIAKERQRAIFYRRKAINFV